MQQRCGQGGLQDHSLQQSFGRAVHIRRQVQRQAEEANHYVAHHGANVRELPHCFPYAQQGRQDRPGGPQGEDQRNRFGPFHPFLGMVETADDGQRQEAEQGDYQQCSASRNGWCRPACYHLGRTPHAKSLVTPRGDPANCGRPGEGQGRHRWGAK